MAIELSGIKNITKDRGKMAYIIALGFLGVFSYILIIKGDVGDLHRLMTAYNATSGNLRTLAQATEYSGFINAFDSVYITAKDANWLMEELTKLASDTRVKLSSLRPAQAGGIPDYRIIRVAAEGEASYRDLLNFIRKLENHENRLFVEELSLSVVKESRQAQGAPMPKIMNMGVMGPGTSSSPEQDRKSGEYAPRSEENADFKLIVAFLTRSK